MENKKILIGLVLGTLLFAALPVALASELVSDDEQSQSQDVFWRPGYGHRGWGPYWGGFGHRWPGYWGGFGHRWPGYWGGYGGYGSGYGGYGGYGSPFFFGSRSIYLG